ncbi:hypothetical protein [Streptomyces sp. NBC_00354]|uniref:hypothetical protein n=1 Tax=Streptomyces sp. NBC_00354 TaxID=2975723 RepID=UPI002E2763A6
MSGKSPVDPAEVPVFTGDLGELDKQVKAISSGGATVSTKASDVHTSFGGLQAFYQAPEADQLFATTKPVQDLGLKLSSDMCTIAGALGTYARDAEPLVNRLKTLKREAESFRSRVSDDEKWFEDGDLIDQNLERRNAIAEVWAHFQDVESACYAKIAALVGKPGLKKDDGSHGEGMYGYDAEALKQSKSLPWGDAVEESVPAWQIWEHAWDFGTGFIVDGIGGTLMGLGGLVGLDGWDTFKASWTGLAKLSTATAITSIPGVGPLFFAVPDDKMPSWLRESRTAMKETGKALLAWDQWGSNPSRAAGAVTFNVVTTVCTGGTGGAVSGAGKAGAVAKALSFASKAGRAVDPMTYVFKGAGAGVSKIGDVMAGLKGAGKFETPKINVDGATALPEGTVHLPDGAIHLPAGSAVPDGAIKLPDGNIKLPEGTTTLPPGTVKLPVDGPPQYMDPKYNIYNHKGEIIQHAADVPKGKPAAGADVPRVDAPKVDSPATAKIPERQLAGAVAGGDGIRLSSDISDPVHAADHTPGPHPDTTPDGHAPDDMPRNSADPHRPGSGGSSPETPSTGGHAETPGGTGHTDGASGTGGGHHEPPSTGGGHGDTTSGGHGDGSGPGHGDSPGGHPDNPILPGGSEPRPDGARYIEEPKAGHVAAARFYDQVRANPESLDIQSISENTGISTQVLDRVRTHFFLTEQMVLEAPGITRRGYFTPRSDIAKLWEDAGQRNLTSAEATKFERYIGHEFTESHFLEAGLPYLRDAEHLWEYYRNEDESGYYHSWPESYLEAGAHELALNENRGGFSQWRGLGLDLPEVELAPGLSNIDEVTAALLQELRSKGIAK